MQIHSADGSVVLLQTMRGLLLCMQRALVLGTWTVGETRSSMRSEPRQIVRGCLESFLATYQHNGQQRQQRGPPDRKAKHGGLQRVSAGIGVARGNVCRISHGTSAAERKVLRGFAERICVESRKMLVTLVRYRTAELQLRTKFYASQKLGRGEGALHMKAHRDLCIFSCWRCSARGRCHRLPCNV